MDGNSEIDLGVHRSKKLESDRKFLESVFDRIPGMIYVHDLVQDVNLYRSWTLKRVLGYENKQLLNSGKDIRGLVHQDDLPEFQRAAKELQCAKDNQAVQFNYRMRHGNGNWVWFKSEEYVYDRDSGGRPIKCLGYATDISDTVEQQIRLKSLNEMNELLLRSSQLLANSNQKPELMLQGLAEEVANYFQAVCDISVLDKTSEIIQPLAIAYSCSEIKEVIQRQFASVKVKKGQGLVGSVISKGEEVCIQEVPAKMKIGPKSVDERIVPISIMYVPLIGANGTVGSVNLTRLQGSEVFQEEELNQIRRVGQYVSLFVENMLFRQEQDELAIIRKRTEARLEAEKSWTDFKIEVSELLANVEMELEDVLQKLCTRITDFFDVVSDFQLLQEDGRTIRLVALHHSDARVKEAIQELLDNPEMKVGEGMVGKVVQTGKELYLPEMPEEVKQRIEAEKVNSLIVPRSFAYIPLKSRGRVLGTLDLTRLLHQRSISEGELLKMRDLAQYATNFIDNRLLQRSQEREIDKRKRAELKLARSSKMLERLEAETRQMLNAIPVYIARISKDLRYLFLNDAYKQRGVNPRSLEGKHIKELLGEAGLSSFSEKIDRALKGEVVTFEHQVVDSAGKTSFLSVALAPDYSDGEEVVGFYSCSTDITSQVLAEKTAELTQDRFESLSLNSGDAFFFHDEDKNILDVNQVASDLLGYSRDELLAMKAEDIDPRWNEGIYQRYLQELDENMPQTFDTNVVAKSGREIPAEVRFVKRLEDGKTYIQSLIRDRTDKRIQEERLLESEQNLRLVFDNVEDYIATIDSNGLILSINKTDESINPVDVIGASIYNFYNSEEAVQLAKQKFPKLISSGEAFEVEDHFNGAKGEQIFSVKYNAIFREGKFLKAVVILRDITAERTRERSVMNAVIRGQEQERKRLGADLHDGIGQILSAIALKVSRINENSTQLSQQSAESALSELSLNLQSAIKEVRNISHDLMPDVLEGFGLKEALRQTCNNLQERSLMKLVFSHFDLEKRYDPTIELNLFRITQELLNNAQKHSAGKQVFVTLIDHGESLSLTVEDDGVGFDQTHLTDGIGLKNVRSRVNLMRGKFDVETAENSGTLVNIEVPNMAI